MDFERAMQYLDDLASYEKMVKITYGEQEFNLKKLLQFVDRAGIDYSKIKYIHVGGSKGKGTTAKMIAQYLCSAGWKTGLFLSPHILNVRERFWLNDKDITEQNFLSVFSEIKRVMDENSGVKITYFEMLFVMALKFFVEQAVDYVVLEVGLGGRLDATNIVRPVLSLLTRVEKEHTDVFGEDIGGILDEKLGIQKNGVPFMIGSQTIEVRKIIEQKLGRKKVLGELIFVDELGGVVDLKNFNQAMIENGKLVHACINTIFGRVDEDIFAGVFNNFRFLGRFDVRQVKGKTVVFDLAHTENSINNLLQCLGRIFPGRKMVFLFSMMKGKKVVQILKLIARVAGKIIFTTSNPERGYGALELSSFWKNIPVEKKVPPILEENPLEAYEKAVKTLGDEEILVVTGSHFLLSRILLENGGE